MGVKLIGLSDPGIFLGFSLEFQGVRLAAGLMRVVVIRIAEIEQGSIADQLHLEIGTRIVRINGERVRDGIDLTFLLADPELEIEAVAPDGEALVLDIEREPGESVGIVPAPDKVRECANKCVFCFIDGNPEGARDTLWLKDDDFRLSFTYGSYVTLTNLGPKGLQRLIDQRISPLYVSVHATEPEVRRRLLVNERAGLIVEQLEQLLEAGLSAHTQVVLCPEWNDGEHLDRTIEDLYGLGEGIQTLSVVPVGLTRYNVNRPVRLVTPAEAAKAIEQVGKIRARSLGERGVGWAYAADEMFLIAGRSVPQAAYYDDGVLTENGIGAVHRFFRELDEGLPTLPNLNGRRIRIVTGQSMGPLIRDRAQDLAHATQAVVDVVSVVNQYFGETVTIAGLLGGNDVVGALGESRPGDIVLIPGEALNADALFIDSVPFGVVRDGLAPATVVSGYELAACLSDLPEQAA